MITDIADFERRAESLSRRASGVLAGAIEPAAPDEQTRRRRQARQLRQSIRGVVSTANTIGQEWAAFVREIGDYSADDQLTLLREEVAVADEYERLLDRGRELWGVLFRDNPDTELMADIERAKALLLRVRRQADAAVHARTEPFVPLDPTRYADAVRLEAAGPWVPAKDAVARFRDATD